ncbi:MAG TPA: YncE family protein [Chloroflexota bacterium]|nr:YncE family protein [Chloroflexota bacterium]
MFTTTTFKGAVAGGALAAALLAQSTAALAAPLSPAVIATVTVDLHPRGVAVNPNTNHVYTANDHNTVTVVDGATNQVTGNILLGGQPGGIGVLNALNRVFVASISSTGFGSLAVIDGGNNSVMTYIPIGFETSPAGVAVNQNTGRVYVAVPGNNSVAVIDGLSNSLVDTVNGIVEPVGMAVNLMTNRVYVASLDHKVVTVIDGASDHILTGIDIGVTSVGSVAVNPDTNRVYAGTNGAVVVIDGNTDALMASISTSSTYSNYGMVVSAAQNLVYVSTQGLDTLTIVDGATNKVMDTLPVGSAPLGVADNPNTNRAYVANTSSSTLSVIGDALLQLRPMTPRLSSSSLQALKPI